ncbi:hypothetical protein BBO99_00008582 [Phytophthora kernoviae]|uniref:Nucleotide-diphospho-sugar transferase domain-containing protein n=1 Tax=Phytophthora kernoviae TaxID=325452 RepID=A0A3R7J1M9_9STRA|nr:hypothetical protein JM16_008345 [Phytophthora kernoviae]KAG2514235.1 hypothetical protein JM18_008277 [Phytophthora kernoviae]RLN06476.1 hypothetical protein BBI17_008585 [Phytophthora kernoviae]RLN75036.1 hypothetical protein BBO99_00008582 [Phytophthora kernoviae]
MLPVEVPYCGDLRLERWTKLSQQDPLVRFYDVCELATDAAVESSDDRKLFCVDLGHCHDKFRGFDIKVLAVVYSRFQEVMLLDADTLFFQSPMALWETDKYKSTGTLFFHDRICLEYSFLAARSPFVGGQDGMAIGALHRFLADFNVKPYHQLDVVGRRDPSLQYSEQLLGLDLDFQPSSFLINSHAWKLHTGHQMDSSLVLWNKARQPRATAILASFISLNGLPTVPSYGDKELFWIACELAETAYAFSDFAVGAIGPDLVTSGSNNDGVLCGDALQHFPEQIDAAKGSEADAEPLAAELYPGSFTERKLPLSCPFDVTTTELAPAEATLLTQRFTLSKNFTCAREKPITGDRI